MAAAKTPFIFTLFEEVSPARGNLGPLECEVFGAGGETLELAKAEAAKHAEWFKARSGREHCAEFFLLCEHCGYVVAGGKGARGIEPGFTKKKCTACGGAGKFEIV